MEEREIIETWKRLGKDRTISIDTDAIISDIEQNMEQIEKNIRARDRREIYGCIGGIGLYLYLATSLSSVVSQFVCILMIGWFGYVIYRLKNIKKNHLTQMDVSVEESLKMQLVYLTKQAHLLNSVFYWYLLPPFLLNVVFVLGLDVGPEGTLTISGSSLVMRLVMISLIGLMFWYIYKMNRSAVVTNYVPAIAKIEKALEELSPDTNYRTDR